MSRRLAAAMVGALLLSGCMDSPTLPPDDVARAEASPHSPSRDTATPDPPAHTERDARAASLRLRVGRPDTVGPSTGSGFAIAPRLIITNAHVVAGSSSVELATWDGDDAEGTAMDIALRNDLAWITTRDRVPAEPLNLASDDPRSGQRVTVVGYPGGGRITVEEHVEVLALEAGDTIGQAGQVVVLGARTVEPGSSGGPVLDANGEVVAVVFDIAPATGDALAIPVSTLRAWVDIDMESTR